MQHGPKTNIARGGATDHGGRRGEPLRPVAFQTIGGPRKNRPPPVLRKKKARKRGPPPPREDKGNG